MAASDALPVARKNVAYRVQFGIYKNDGTLITGATGLDSEVSKDSAAFADCTSEATEIGSSGVYYLDLTSTEMNADVVSILVKSTSTGAVPVILTINPEEGGDIRVNATHLAGTAQTGRDIGASVLLSSGTGTGQVNLSSGRADANITYIGGSVLNTSNPQIGVNVVNAAGTAWNSGGITASTVAGNAITAASIAPAALDADALATDAVNEIVTAIKAMVVESNDSRTLGQVLSVIYAACAGVTSSGGTVLKDPTGVSTRITATIDGSNNRTAMTITPSA
jgi:hypothetical protein